MKAARKREQLISILNKADDKKISMFYEIIDDLNNNFDAKLTRDQLTILENRRNEMLAGKNIITDWEEMHDQIKSKRNLK